MSIRFLSFDERKLRPRSNKTVNSDYLSGSSRMGCFVVLFALISPRLALFAICLFSDLLSRAYDTWVLPLLGFFLLPWTTLAYAVMWDGSHRVTASSGSSSASPSSSTWPPTGPARRSVAR